MHAKIHFLSIVFLVLPLVLVARLAYWQIIEGAKLAQAAKLQYKSSRVISASRGNILASDGSFWAVRSEAWRIVANPQDIKDPLKRVAEELAPFFVEDKESQAPLLAEIDRLIPLLGKKGSFWVPLKTRVNSEDKKNIEALGIAGVGFEAEDTRFYAEASVAAQILGFVGKNDEGVNTGYFGLEGYYDLPLAGKPGFVGRDSDASGSPIFLAPPRQVSAVSGVDLITSIDKRIQLILYNRLKEGIEKYGAKAGTVIVMEPATGKILGMESYPSYDPSLYWEYGDSYFKNPAISDSFEPGSVFKVLVIAAALDAKIIEPDTVCDICDGPVKVDKYTIETWDRKYRPSSTVTDVIVHSDNVGMTYVGQKLGADILYDYLDKFGIGKISGIDLQGEASPLLRKKGTWNVVDLATASFGQGVAVTPIQMVRAVSAIANDGILVTPSVVEEVKGDGWSREIKPGEAERVISADSANKVTAMMAEAASQGEAKWTNLKGFKVAGKTGTAQIPIAGHYDEEKTNASFIGFMPYDRPKFVMLVTLRETQSSPWASETAAPLWYSIARDIITTSVYE